MQLITAWLNRQQASIRDLGGAGQQHGSHWVQGKEGEEGLQARAQQSASVVPWPTAEAARGQQGVRGQAAAAAAAVAAAAAAAGGARPPMLGDPALAAAISAARADPNAAAKSAGGSDLFDALLMAATGGVPATCLDLGIV